MPEAIDLDVREIAMASKQGTVDGLAALVVLNDGASVEKLAAMAKLDIGVMHRLLTTREFRERVTELMTYQELDIGTERKILQRMLKEATREDDEQPFKVFERAATWVYRQGGMLRADRQEVDVNNNIKISFTRDFSPDADFKAPNPMAGVVGVEDGRTIDVEADDGREPRPRESDANAESDD